MGRDTPDGQQWATSNAPYHWQETMTGKNQTFFTPTIKITLIVAAVFLTCIGGILMQTVIRTLSDETSSTSASTQPIEPIDTWRDDDNTWLARGITKDFVRNNLRSPSTARFPGVTDGWGDHTTYLGNQRYQTVSWVESQNGFGATLRMNYTAIVEQTGEDSWRLESLDFDE